LCKEGFFLTSNEKLNKELYSDFVIGSDPDTKEKTKASLECLTEITQDETISDFSLKRLKIVELKNIDLNNYVSLDDLIKLNQTFDYHLIENLPSDLINDQTIGTRPTKGV